MSRRDYRISICFSDKAVASLVSHWNSIHLVYQGPMWKSKPHLTLYQLSITYMWTLPVSTQQVMILLSIRQLANSNNNNKRQKRRQKPGRLEITCLAGSEDFVFALFSSPFGVDRVSGLREIMHSSPCLWFNCYQQSSRSITEVCLNFIRRYNLCYFPTVPNKP